MFKQQQQWHTSLFSGRNLSRAVFSYHKHKRPESAIHLGPGGDYCQPQQSFVIIEREALPVKTMMGAVDLCYKAYQVLDMKYSSQPSSIWLFLDSLVYAIKVPNKPGTVPTTIPNTLRACLKSLCVQQFSSTRL